jgi:MFS family permease
VFSQSLGTIMGALVVLTLSNLLSPEAMDSWGWRAVFAVGILAIPVSEYIRHRLEETLPAATQGDSRQAREGGRRCCAGIRGSWSPACCW